MATSNVGQTRKGLKAKPFANVGFDTSRQTRWHVPLTAPKTVDDLTFTSRDADGRIVWWDVTPPKTNYGHVHEMLGRAYAFEVLDLLNNPQAEADNAGALGYIMDAISRSRGTSSGGAGEGMASGFFSVISEYVATGSADR